MTEVAPPRFIKTAPVPTTVWASVVVSSVQVAASLISYPFRLAEFPGARPNIVVLVIGFGVGIGIFLLIQRAILRGSNGARVFVTVLSALSTVILVVGLFTGNSEGGLLGVVVDVSLVLNVLAVVLLWLPASNAFFRSVKAERVAFDRAQAEVAAAAVPPELPPQAPAP